MTLILVSLSAGGCSVSRTDGAFARMGDNDVTGSIGGSRPAGPAPTESDLAFARNAASDVLTRGDKDASQPWENPETGARGSVTPLQRLLLKQFLTRLDLIDSQIEQLDQALATAMEPYSDAIQRLSEIPEWDPMRQHRSVLRSGQRPGCSPH